jgi:hypothetical protein
MIENDRALIRVRVNDAGVYHPENIFLGVPPRPSRVLHKCRLEWVPPRHSTACCSPAIMIGYAIT